MSLRVCIAMMALSLPGLAAVAGVQEPQSVVLPERAATEIMQQCSRTAPKVDSAWTPAAAQVEELERHLGDLAQVRGERSGKVLVEHPERSYRQYIGVVVRGQRFIYVNGVSQPSPGWHQRLVVVCDGGANFWGALYNPGSRSFSELITNGPF